jgi:hypothetical protein
MNQEEDGGRVSNSRNHIDLNFVGPVYLEVVNGLKLTIYDSKFKKRKNYIQTPFIFNNYIKVK